MEIDQIIGYIYSLFGRTLHYVQIIEKGIMNSIILIALENNVSRSRYHELLFEYYSKTTGQLLREFKVIIPHKDISLFENFQEIRDYLAHNFWWETNLDFENKNSIDKTIEELNDYISSLEILVDYLDDFRIEFEKRHSLRVKEELNKTLFLTSMKEIRKYRKLEKNEVIIDIFEYKQLRSSSVPVFKLSDNTHWEISDIGLSQFFESINDSRKNQIEELNGIFPIKQFNPRPKIKSPWNYELLLKRKGLKILIKPKPDGRPFDWNIE